MNPIAASNSIAAAAQAYTLRMIRPVQPIVPNAERIMSPETDTYEPGTQEATPSVTYGRNGR